MFLQKSNILKRTEPWLFSLFVFNCDLRDIVFPLGVALVPVMVTCLLPHPRVVAVG